MIYHLGFLLVSGCSQRKWLTASFAGGVPVAYSGADIISRLVGHVGEGLAGAEAVDAAIAKGVDLDGSPIPEKKLSLYNDVMGLEANRKRSGVSNSMRSRIVRIGAKHLSLDELNARLVDADFAPLKDKEVAFYYGGK